MSLALARLLLKLNASQNVRHDKCCCYYFFNRFVFAVFFIYFYCRYWANKHRFERTQSHRCVGPFSLLLPCMLHGCVCALRALYKIRYAHEFKSSLWNHTVRHSSLLARWQTYTHAHSPRHIITLQNVHIFGILNSFINTIRIHSLIFFAVLGRWWWCFCCCCCFFVHTITAHMQFNGRRLALIYVCVRLCVWVSELQLKQHMILFNETICEYTLLTHAKSI